MILTGNKVVVTVNDNGSYALRVGSFELTECRIKIDLDEIDCTPIVWQSKAIGETAIELTAENESGSWLTEFMVDEERLSIKLTGTLKKAVRLAKLYTLQLPQITASHLLSQGAKMGSCKSLLTAAHRNESFEGFHQLMITNNDEKLQLSYPLKQCQPAKFTGKVADGAVIELAAYSEIMHYGKLHLETEPLYLQAAIDGIQLMNNYAD